MLIFEKKFILFFFIAQRQKSGLVGWSLFLVWKTNNRLEKAYAKFSIIRETNKCAFNHHFLGFPLQ
jgi:hypothetical protein